MKRKLNIVAIFLFTFITVRGVSALAIEGAEIANLCLRENKL